MDLTLALQPEDLASLDQVCRDQRVSRLDAVESALRWYIQREGNLPTIDFGDETEPD